ncbi:hypothetical protein GCM10010275_69210 [Streptomyces litmocidini]|nr:hypothetical protein GCM10010275_69210 [Streptomyces litmocidini]
MNVNLVPDDLWDRIAPLLPARPRRHSHPGRLPVPDRVALTGIVYVLRKDMTWRDGPDAEEEAMAGSTGHAGRRGLAALSGHRSDTRLHEATPCPQPRSDPHHSPLRNGLYV